MVYVYFTRKEMVHNVFLAVKELCNYPVNRSDPYIDARVFSRPPEECFYWKTEFAQFKELEYYYYNAFVDHYLQHYDIARANEHAKHKVKTSCAVTVTVQQYHVLMALLDIYSKAFMESINKLGDQNLGLNRVAALATCHDSVNWCKFCPQCEIDGVILEGKLGKTLDLDEIVKQQQWQEKKQRVFDFFRNMILAFLSLFLVICACCALYDVVGAKVVAAVESFDYQAVLPSIDFSFLETGPADTKTTTTAMPYTVAEHVNLVQRQATPAHLDEERGLALYDLVQDLLSEEQEVGESCCHRDNVVCRAKALLLHSIPEDLASYWMTAQEQVEQEAEPIDFVSFVLEHEFLFHEYIAEDDSTPTSDVYQRWFKWILDWLSSDQTAVPINEPTNETTTTTPVDSPTPTIFPLDTAGCGPQESNLPSSDVCPNNDSIVDIVVQALQQLDNYIDEQASSGCQKDAAWANPLCYLY